MRTPEYWRTGGAVSCLLAPAGWLYGLGGALRFALARPARASVPVVCVGNLTAGGTGKTPLVMEIARRLGAMGRRPHVVSRGYGGALKGPIKVDPDRHFAADVGDEPLLIARRCPVWVARDRVAGAALAAEGGADIVILDDGFQNPALVKDLSILVVDGETGFGNGRLIPAGPLREPLRWGLARAHAAIVMGEDRAGAGAAIAAVAPGLPVIAARLRPDAAAARLAGRRVLGFAGIGRPEKVRATLQALGAEVAAFRAFPDHHAYTAGEIAALKAEAEALGAVPVTTEKDLVRLSDVQRAGVEAVAVTAEVADEAAFSALFSAFSASSPSSAAPAAPGRAG